MKAKEAAAAILAVPEAQRPSTLIKLIAEQMAALLKARSVNGVMSGDACAGVANELDVWVEAIKQAGPFPWISEHAGRKAFDAVYHRASMGQRS